MDVADKGLADGISEVIKYILDTMTQLDPELIGKKHTEVVVEAIEGPILAQKTPPSESDATGNRVENTKVNGVISDVTKVLLKAISWATGGTKKEIASVAEKNVWGYYIVDCESKHLLWLSDHMTEANIYQGAASKTHLGNAYPHPDLKLLAQMYTLGQQFKVEYYRHLSYFPHGHELDKTFIEETKGILIWGLTGNVSQHHSSVS